VSKFVPIVVLGLLLAISSRASAATYEVSACRLPSGTPAPANGWTTYGTRAASQINCPGGAMTSKPAAGQHSARALLGFEFAAPAGTTIAGYERHADGDTKQVLGAPPPWNWIYGEFGTVVGNDEILALGACDNCGAFTAEWLRPDITPRLTRLFAGLRCGSQIANPCDGIGAFFALHWITLRLEDLRPPQILGASGSLIETAPQRGQRYLLLRLRDIGGGLLKTRVEVDGQRFSEQAVDDNAGRCRTPYTAPVPCKLAADVELPVDTSRIADGDHHLSVRIFDATGINSALYGPVPITVDNAPGSAGRAKLICPAAADGTLSRRLGARTTPFGGMASVSGRVGGGISVRGARVKLVDPSGAPAAAGTARVGHRRRFRLRLRVRKPLLVRPVLVAPSGAPRLCGAQLRLRVRAGVRFAVAPKRLVNGETIKMKGRLLGLPVPSTGKTIVIQARARGIPTWTNVSTVRSGSSGRFTFRYRFRRTFQRTVYEFRAVAPKQRAYPFARGWSRSRSALVLP
jgi:hypothetical protein